MINNKNLDFSILKDGYDLHIHSSPSHFPRLLDDIEIIKSANSVGMKGILIKSHYESTGARAIIANKYSDCNTKAFGSIVLNHPVGGLNPFAVYSALKIGVKFVFMPTRDSFNCLKYGNMEGDFFKREGISILNENRKLKKEVLTIIDIIKKYDAVLATGHISTEESIVLCKEGYKKDIKMVFTHPEWPRTKANTEVQKELADLGVFIEKCWYNIADNNYSIEEMVHTIKTIGAKKCFLTTDRGQIKKESPIEAMAMFTKKLLDNGITEKEIKQMLKITPNEIIK